MIIAAKIVVEMDIFISSIVVFFFIVLGSDVGRERY